MWNTMYNATSKLQVATIEEVFEHVNAHKRTERNAVMLCCNNTMMLIGEIITEFKLLSNNLLMYSTFTDRHQLFLSFNLHLWF